MSAPFTDHCTAAMAVLTSGVMLSPSEGRFLGQLAFDAHPLSQKQRRWLALLLDKHGLPPLAAGDGE